MPIESRMSLIMGQIELEHAELFALEFGIIAESDLFTLQHLQILTNQRQTRSKYKILVEFYYGCNQTRTL